MRIGIYGGTYNPPHLGHLTAARTVFEMLKLDKLLLIPASVPPHKELPAGSPTSEQRLEMTRLMGEQLNLGDRVETLDIELRREGKSYTSDTLETIREMYPDADLWLVMGADMFLSFQTWHEPGRILELAGVVTFARTEDGMEEEFARQRHALYQAYPHAHIHILSIPDVVEVSSTELREKLARGQGERLLHPVVYGYILRCGLYGTGADLKHLTFPQLRAVCLSYLKRKRIPHVLATEQEAVRLAERYGADVDKARTAALLHDITKKLEMDEQMELCRHYDLELDELEKVALKLLHAKTAAAIARDIFGVDDEIYTAIYWHTTGHANMTKLEKIIYLADYIEATRDFPGLEELRRVCNEEGLDAGMVLGLSMTVTDMKERGNPVHSATLAALADLKGTEST